MGIDANGIVASVARPGDERLLVAIERHDTVLHLGLSSDLAPVDERFQGGLAFVRGLVIDGRIVSSGRLHSKTIRVRLSPIPPSVEFGDDGLDEVGQLYFPPPKPRKADVSATLLLPESALPLAAICLSSTWRYVHLWTFDPDDERASVSAFSFSATPPEASARG